MHFDFRLDRSDLLIDHVIPDLAPIWPQPARVRILVVHDTISIGPPGAGFSLGRVVSYLLNDGFGFVEFEVHFARMGTTADPTAVSENTAAGDYEFRYTNFRYNSEIGGNRIIDDYDQVWLFGIRPLVHDDGPNEDVFNSPYSATPDELDALTDWMDAGGGVLAMGDHNILGSGMCWNVPRVGTMRAWLKDSDDYKSVPDRVGSDRHDTNRPADPSQDPTVTFPPAVIPTAVERDTVTQPLEWVAFGVWSPFVFERRSRPHPVLCGGSLGVIDRFPDHPHEGLVIDEHLIDLTAKCQHDDSRDEYPTVGGVQPAPQTIAWVNTLPDPPYNHSKGYQPARRFPAIGVYNGHSIDHGRVLVDSTWHHWFDMNIAELEAADTTDFRKIKRYFQNVAIWLSPKPKQQTMLAHAAFWATLNNGTYEEFSPDVPPLSLGGLALDVLGRATSDCLVTDWIHEIIPIPIDHVWPEIPWPDPCWSCPPDWLIPRAVLGGIVREMIPMRDRIVESAWSGERKALEIDAQEIEKLARAGVQTGLKATLDSVRENRKAMEQFAEAAEQVIGRAAGKGG